ncbi:MAG: pantoate--beta-alanine ligase [Shimia sp.]
MEVHATKDAMRTAVRALKARGKTVACVPTMGALHDGHLALVRRGAEMCDAVVASIFVNPTQFGEAADLDAYPKTLDADLAAFKAGGVSAVFTPRPEVMYPNGPDAVVDVPSLSGILQGKVRPGHFQGVATVVTKLFHIMEPDVALFGQKDYQQLAVIRRMVADLDFPLRIEGVPTVREADGLAMSSRNVRLTPADRTAATVLNRALDACEAREHDPLTAEEFRAIAREVMAREPRADIRAIDIRDAATLAPIWGRLTAPAVLLLSVRFGEVLLIDNRVIGPGKDTL